MVLKWEGGTYRDKAPGTDDGGEELAAADVDVLGCEGHEIVGCADGVG